MDESRSRSNWLGHPISNWKHTDMRNSDRACLGHDDIACVGSVHFSIGHGNRTNGIGSFFPLSRTFEFVATAEHGEETSDCHWQRLQRPSPLRRASAVVVVAWATMFEGRMNPMKWVISIVGRRRMLVWIDPYWHSFPLMVNKKEDRGIWVGAKAMDWGRRRTSDDEERTAREERTYSWLAQEENSARMCSRTVSLLPMSFGRVTLRYRRRPMFDCDRRLRRFSSSSTMTNVTNKSSDDHSLLPLFALSAEVWDPSSNALDPDHASCTDWSDSLLCHHTHEHDPSVWRDLQREEMDDAVARRKKTRSPYPNATCTSTNRRDIWMVEKWSAKRRVSAVPLAIDQRNHTECISMDWQDHSDSILHSVERHWCFSAVIFPRFHFLIHANDSSGNVHWPSPRRESVGHRSNRWTTSVRRNSVDSTRKHVQNWSHLRCHWHCNANYRVVLRCYCDCRDGTSCVEHNPIGSERTYSMVSSLNPTECWKKHRWWWCSGEERIVAYRDVQRRSAKNRDWMEMLGDAKLKTMEEEEVVAVCVSCWSWVVVEASRSVGDWLSVGRSSMLTLLSMVE